MSDLPFRVELRPGLPVHEQVVLAVHRATLSRQLEPGEPFPSVRSLSQALRINPNTAHRIVQTLVARGVLAVRPGIGTVVGNGAVATRTEKHALLEGEVERLVVEARRLDLALEDVTAAVERHWKRIDRR